MNDFAMHYRHWGWVLVLMASWLLYRFADLKHLASEACGTR